AGEVAVIPVTVFDPDGDNITFRLASTPTGEQPPSFVTIEDSGGGFANVIIDTGDINEGPSNLTFRIAVEAIDLSDRGPGGRLPLTGRSYFPLAVMPNSPHVIGPIPNQTRR